MKRLVILAAALAVAGGAAAQSKKDLATKIYQLQKADVDNIAQGLVQYPADTILRQSAPYLQNKVAADKRESIGMEIQADVKKYMDETTPLVRERVHASAPGVMTPMLEQKFSEDELKQLAAFLESPVAKKYHQVMPEIMKSVYDKVGTEVNTSIVQPRATTLSQNVGKRLGFVAPSAASAPAAALAPSVKKP
ncbi:MAG: hypothetical protein RJA44_1756 [Pseudomonadota bacterium]|jgi:hypothetical protein